MTNKAEGTHLVSEQDKELQITPGKAEVRNNFTQKGLPYHPIIHVREKVDGITKARSIGQFQSSFEVTEQDQANATLYADAHNTYNACKKLPSALLREIQQLKAEKCVHCNRNDPTS